MNSNRKLLSFIAVLLSSPLLISASRIPNHEDHTPVGYGPEPTKEPVMYHDVDSHHAEDSHDDEDSHDEKEPDSYGNSPDPVNYGESPTDHPDPATYGGAVHPTNNPAPDYGGETSSALPASTPANYGDIVTPTPTETSTPCTTSTTIMHPTIEPTPPCTDRTVHAAVLFEATQFGGIKHWIDGQVGECRGLSGVPVGSIQMVASAGADPFMNPVEDNVQVAFFDDYGCMGKLLGVVAGSNPNTLSLIQQSTGVNSTTGGKVLSARWVAPGVNKPYMNMQFDGKSNPSSGGVATVASGLAGFVAAAVAYLI